MLKNITLTLLLLLMPAMTYAMVGAEPTLVDGEEIVLLRTATPDRYIKTDSSDRIYLVRDEIRYWLYNEAMINVHITDDVVIEDVDSTIMKELEEGRDMFLPTGTLVKKVIGHQIFETVGEGELSWLRSPSIVQEKYGNNWGEKVQVVPDKYFKKYTIVD
ncbi:MAG: hypothetical protein ACKKL6_02240 [Candidatus Komeilibacteria bacterium]